MLEGIWTTSANADVRTAERPQQAFLAQGSQLFRCLRIILADAVATSIMLSVISSLTSPLNCWSRTRNQIVGDRDGIVVVGADKLELEFDTRVEQREAAGLKHGSAGQVASRREFERPLGGQRGRRSPAVMAPIRARATRVPNSKRLVQAGRPARPPVPDARQRGDARATGEAGPREPSSARDGRRSWWLLDLLDNRPPPTIDHQSVSSPLNFWYETSDQGSGSSRKCQY